MGTPVQFDPWAVLQELRQTPAAIAATAANRPNAAVAAVAAGGGRAEIRARQPGPLPLPPEWVDALARIQARAQPQSIPAERWRQSVADARYLVQDWAAERADAEGHRISRRRLPADHPQMGRTVSREGPGRAPRPQLAATSTASTDVRRSR